ncbi:MAG: homoserine kinase [Betaproteobacteria bacterium]|nr:homoserine kinase [Betaproteobacteria bacterium]
MSVYTPVSEGQLAGWLKGYSVGALAELQPIESGIENTNYFVTTGQGRYVLTLFERLSAAEIPFYLDLMAHLARHGVPCPAPIANHTDQFLSELNGKPAALVSRLQGRSLERTGAAECAELGALLARMHLAGRSYSAFQENPRGPRWQRGTARELQPFLDAGQRRLLEDELAAQAAHHYPDLPRGPVHADLFRDNALFEARGDGARLCGVIDFYFAGVDCLLYDLAVCANDWCLVDPAADPRLDGPRVRALLGAYHAQRPLTPAEARAWPLMLRAAALRFWISRLHDFHLPRPGELVRVHDPEHFRAIVAMRAADPAPPWLAPEAA